MTENCFSKRCAFLSMDSLDEHVCDDDLAIAPLAARGVHVDTVSWRREDVDWGDYDWVIVRSSWDYQEHSAQFLDALAKIDESRAVLANPLTVIRSNIDKRYLGDLAARGIPIVPTRYGEGLDSDTLAALLAAEPGGRHVIKPVVSAGAFNTFVVSSDMPIAELRAAADAHRTSAWMLQPFVTSVQTHGEYSLFLFNGVVSHTILKTPKDGDFRVQEEFGSHIQTVVGDTNLMTAGLAVYQALGASLLYARIDLVEINGTYCLMEAELIEPSLYLRYAQGAPDAFADGCLAWFDAQTTC